MGRGDVLRGGERAAVPPCTLLVVTHVDPVEGARQAAKLLLPPESGSAGAVTGDGNDCAPFAMVAWPDTTFADVARALYRERRLHTALRRTDVFLWAVDPSAVTAPVPYIVDHVLGFVSPSLTYLGPHGPPLPCLNNALVFGSGVIAPGSILAFRAPAAPAPVAGQPPVLPAVAGDSLLACVLVTPRHDGCSADGIPLGPQGVLPLPTGIGGHADAIPEEASVSES
mgnify:FL=1